MNCEQLSFSEKLSSQRISKAKNYLGSKVITKILALAFFLLGVNKTVIAATLNMPLGSVKSFILAINRTGLAGIEDQRKKTSTFKPPVSIRKVKPTLLKEGAGVKIVFESENLILYIPDSNPIQKKVILLSLLNSECFNKAEIASALNLSADRTGKLAKKLQLEDVKGIVDNRQGQKKDYVFKPEIKGELIQQFVIEILKKRPTSAQNLSDQLKQRCNITLSSRSILDHLSKLGLFHIQTSLPSNIEEIKKKYPDF